MSLSFFTRDTSHSNDSEWFVPTEHTRGPWLPEHCHAGPPTGLLARSMEQLLAFETGVNATEVGFQRLTRMTVNLQRPIPMQSIQITSTIRRIGRSVSLLEARLLDADGKVCATAEGMHMLVREARDYPTQSRHFGTAADASPGEFPIAPDVHDLPAFTHGVETRFPAGQNSDPGPTTLWLKTVPLLPDETPSPIQRICPLADCGNALGRNADPDSVTFINPDLTLLVHRDPVGEWLGSQSVGYWEPSGIGMADALLFDELGVVGRATQALLLNPVES